MTQQPKIQPKQPLVILAKLDDYNNMTDSEWNEYLIRRGINIFHDISYYIVHRFNVIIVKQWNSYSRFDSNIL